MGKGAQNPKADPGSRAKPLRNSSERLSRNGDLIRQEASGWSNRSPTTSGSSHRDTCSLLKEEAEGWAAAGLPRRHVRVIRAPAARQLSAPPPPQAGRLSPRCRATSHRVLTRLHPKQERRTSRRTLSAIFLPPQTDSCPKKHFSTSLARPWSHGHV